MQSGGCGALKAGLCIEGNQRMRENYQIKGIPLIEYGNKLFPRERTHLSRTLLDRGEGLC